MRHFALRPAQTKQLHACAALFNATSREAFLADAAYLLRRIDNPSDTDVGAVLHRLLGVVPVDQLNPVDLIVFPKIAVPILEPS